MFSHSVYSKTDTSKLSTNDWYNVCTKPDIDWVNFCNGYIQAIVDAYPIGQFCPDASVTRAKLVGLVHAFLIKNPDYKKGLAFNQVSKILSLTYPCN